MKTAPSILLLLFLLAGAASSAQVCPGGGTNFGSAVSFDPAWIYGCNTGTSCNGGVAFDNRASCEPTTSLDACAPPPSCGNISGNGSDIWFTFYAAGPTALISCFQNTSLVLGIQAFNGNSTCGSLTEMGCAIAGGPSSGVQLHLAGLAAGKLYYFRIFGSSTPPSQRTGLYCFCGSTGLGTFLILPVVISGLAAQQVDNGVSVHWLASSSNRHSSFDIERSTDAINFTAIGRLPIIAVADHQYAYTDPLPVNGVNYYRIKNVYANGNYDYSATTAVKINSGVDFSIPGYTVNGVLQVTTPHPTVLLLSDIRGKTIRRISVPAGKNCISTGQLISGIYLLQSADGGAAQKFFVPG